MELPMLRKTDLGGLDQGKVFFLAIAPSYSFRMCSAAYMTPSI